MSNPSENLNSVFGSGYYHPFLLCSWLLIPCNKKKNYYYLNETFSCARQSSKSSEWVTGGRRPRRCVGRAALTLRFADVTESALAGFVCLRNVTEHFSCHCAFPSIGSHGKRPQRDIVASRAYAGRCEALNKKKKSSCPLCLQWQQPDVS